MVKSIGVTEHAAEIRNMNFNNDDLQEPTLLAIEGNIERRQTNNTMKIVASDLSSIHLNRKEIAARGV